MRRIHALILVPLVGLAACSSPTATPTSTAPDAPASSAPATSAPANGATLTGDGFTITLPEGWEDSTEETKKQVPTGLAAAAKGPKAGETLIVVAVTSPEIPLNTYKETLEQQLKASGATDISVKETQLDGQQAIQLSAKAGTATSTNVVAFKSGKMYQMTVGSASGDVTETFTSGWKWTA